MSVEKILGCSKEQLEDSTLFWLKKANELPDVDIEVLSKYAMENDNIREHTRGYRTCLNMLRDPVDNYIEHKDEIEEILKPFTTVSQVQVSPINQEMYISSNWQDQDKHYARVAEICKGSKIYSTDENVLYELDRDLNKSGYKTRMGRNCRTGTLSIAVLEEPERENK